MIGQQLAYNNDTLYALAHVDSAEPTPWNAETSSPTRHTSGFEPRPEHSNN
jgi:hypothetical protein